MAGLVRGAGALMRIGVIVLPQQRRAEAVARWQALEAMGFDHGWVYDHLAWRSLADEPWFATVPALTLAATATTRLRLGTWVASPNFRHPVPFAKELMSLDDISDGRIELGIGTGRLGWDADVLGRPEYSPKQRMDRLSEFVQLLDLLLTQPDTSWRGDWYEAKRARMHPGCVQQPRLPFLVAADGPRGRRLAVRLGEGWVTTGRPGVERDAWWAAVAQGARHVDELLAATDRDPETLRRGLSVDVPDFALSSADHFADVVGRAAELGFTDVVTHWPRVDGPYAGSEAVLEQVAADLPRLRGGG